MGVLGLWNLIDDAGTKVHIETLRGQTLAIDLSIWINQSIKGFRDKDGRVVRNSHVLGLFYRLCKLLYYQIKPIFVFDGDCITLKKKTIQKRHERRSKAINKSKNLSLAVIKNYLQSQLLSLEQPSTSSKGNNSTKATVTRNRLNFNEKTQLLSDLIFPSKKMNVYKEFAERQNQTRLSLKNSNDDADDDEEDDDNKSHKSGYESNYGDNDDDNDYNFPPHQSIRDIDINSNEFKHLPPQTRYEILVEMRESYKGRKNPFPEKLPTDSGVFSNYQMQKLLKKRNLQEEIDKLIDELNGVVDDSVELIKSNSDLVNEHSAITTGRLASDEKTRFILIKGNNKLKKIINEIEKDEIELLDVEDEDDKLNSSMHENMAYRLPNTLPGDSCEKELIINRIEQLSQQFSNRSNNSVFKPAELAGHFNENIKKFTNIKQTSMNEVNLSDNESSTAESDNCDDFIEVPMESVDEENEEADREEIELFEEASLPFPTDYNIEIVVDDNDERCDILPVEKEIISLEESTKSTQNEDTHSVEAIDNVPNDQNLNKEIITIEEDEKTQTESTIETIQLSQAKIIESNIDQPSTSKEMATEEPTIQMDNMIESVKQSIKLNRQAASVDDQMIRDCQELLRLFGVPWVVAPAEAEAQCATLEQLKLCDGIITDDSDVFLFGGKNIFRNFFSNIKAITRYTSEDVEKFFGLTQSKLICLGMLCGTDYTVGIDNVGPVTALEILSEFPGDELEPLENFTKWYREKLNSKDHRPENTVRDKFLRLEIPSSFPNQIIYEAYKDALVDNSTNPFSWSSPQLSELRKYGREFFGWSESRTDSYLLPVLKSLNEKRTQTRIDYYFSSVTRNTKVKEKIQIKRSKRLNAAIHRNIRETKEQFDLCNPVKKDKLCKRPKLLAKSKGKNVQRKAAKISRKEKSGEVILSEDSSNDSN